MSTPQFLDQVYECIRIFQNRGQVVSLDKIADKMEHDHGVTDRQLIQSATEELEAQGRILTPPLLWQTKSAS